MSGPAHSPAPFRLIPAGEDHGHLVLDAFGDSLAALALRTGDHPPEEQLANARLFTAAPGLLTALKASLVEIDFEIEQRQTGGNDEHWQALKSISDDGWRAVRAAEGPRHV